MERERTECCCLSESSSSLLKPTIFDYSVKIGVVDIELLTSMQCIFEEPTRIQSDATCLQRTIQLYIKDHRNFTKLRSYLLIIELFGGKCDINCLLHQRSIRTARLPRRPTYYYYEDMVEQK